MSVNPKAWSGRFWALIIVMFVTGTGVLLEIPLPEPWWGLAMLVAGYYFGRMDRVQPTQEPAP